MRMIMYAVPAKRDEIPTVMIGGILNALTPAYLAHCVKDSFTSKNFVIKTKMVKDKDEEKIKRKRLGKKHKNYIIGGTFDE